jgi:holin-like protein
MLYQYLIIMACLFIGEFISRVVHVPIPGNVLGMIILLLALLMGVVKLEQVEKAADTLIGKLSLFFVPAGVGVMLYFDIISKYALPILGTTVISTLLVLVVTGHVTQLFIKNKAKEVGKRG